MKISIIIPVYNEEKNLPKIVKSLKNQTSQNFETIVVDNNSTDNTYNVAKKLADKVYKCKEQGISPARNFGAKKSKNEIIAFLDADSVASPKWVSTIEEDFNEDKELSVISGLYVYDSKFLSKRIILYILSYIGFYYYKISTYFNKPLIFGNTLAIKRKLFFKVGGFEKVIGEDVHLSFKLRKQKVKCRLDKRMKVRLSDRRMVSAGIFNTYYLWFKSNMRKISSDEYTLHDKINNK